MEYDKVAQVGNWTSYNTSPTETVKLFEEARDKCPVAHSFGHEGFHILLDQQDVRRAMSDHRTFSSRPSVFRPLLPRKPIPGLEMDPPEHGAWRAIFNKAITMKTPEMMEPFVRQDVRRHIARFIENGEADIVRDIAEPVPAETICHLVGIDAEKVSGIKDHALATIAAQGDPASFSVRFGEFTSVVLAEVDLRRVSPRDDFLTELAGMNVGGRPFADEDYAVLLLAFLGAGHHSTTSAMASLTYEVFSRPEICSELTREPAKISIAVEEALRLHPPFFGFFRRTTKPVEMAGVAIPSDEDVYISWTHANLDPKVHQQPADFSLGRANTRHMTFGFGIHVCAGAPLARMELRVLIEELLASIPDMKVPSSPPEYAFGGGEYVYMRSLPVMFKPRSAVVHQFEF